MPKFFIDTSDGDLSVRDEEGFDFSDVHEAREAAIDTLPDMARSKLPDSDHRMFVTTLRDEYGRVIYEATLTMDGAWKVPPAQA